MKTCDKVLKGFLCCSSLSCIWLSDLDLYLSLKNHEKLVKHQKRMKLQRKYYNHRLYTDKFNTMITSVKSDN